MKNFIIFMLVIALGVSFYFLFFNKELVKTGKEITNSPSSDIISPSQELKTSFDESAQHSAMADIAELSCFPTIRYNCDMDGCKPDAPATYYFVDYGTESGTYFRCDAKGCDPYPVKVNLSGEFTQFVPSQGQAMLFKVATGDILGNKGEFVDVATLGTMTLVSFGKCEISK
ncbi:MAG: hypothetical protein PHV78_01685 [Patescibacteria group bacterium]|nr:hypothetical protein [Patescibacteria group bacterium]MDD5121138.1 hypothetical protein [Patescibacteria group bacterium]MDD5221653.1 hypothetical protein [Patescibacteria group bacterium]MDD5395943.1 hypothetical protein [Patescibacteria group bacterium]